MTKMIFAFSPVNAIKNTMSHIHGKITKRIKESQITIYLRVNYIPWNWYLHSKVNQFVSSHVLSRKQVVDFLFIIHTQMKKAGIIIMSSSSTKVTQYLIQ